MPTPFAYLLGIFTIPGTTPAGKSVAGEILFLSSFFFTLVSLILLYFKSRSVVGHTVVLHPLFCIYFCLRESVLNSFRAENHGPWFPVLPQIGSCSGGKTVPKLSSRAGAWRRWIHGEHWLGATTRFNNVLLEHSGLFLSCPKHEFVASAILLERTNRFKRKANRSWRCRFLALSQILSTLSPKLFGNLALV